MSANDSIKPSHILAVDDSPDNLFLIETVLDNDEYTLSYAESGREALDKVIKTPPDLILLDVMMPGMTGYEVTAQIRKNQSLPYIPILLVTAHGQPSLVEGLDVGADDFIRKPFNIEELQARIRCLLRLKRAMDDQSFMIRQRDDFVARLTHDLRTPLVAANRMLQFCKDEAFGEIADEAKEAITETIQNNKQLLGMVNTLLEVYRHESGNKALTHISLNLYDTAATVIDELRPLADEKALDLKLTQCGETSADNSEYRIQGDAMELRRVMTNLIGNAIKFTDKGYVEVNFAQGAHTPDEIRGEKTGAHQSHWLGVRVTDTGVGISPEDQSEIFEWFRQGKQRRSGSGLGLHLAYRIITMHGGFIDVESAVDEGSTFTVYLPSSPSS